jgi:hypothetical protein
MHPSENVSAIQLQMSHPSKNAIKLMSHQLFGKENPFGLSCHIGKT